MTEPFTYASGTLPDSACAWENKIDVRILDSGCYKCSGLCAIMERNEFRIVLRGHLMQAAKKFAIIIGGVILIGLIIGLVVAFIYHALLTVLYVFLIILAILLTAATAFQIYSIVMLIRTIRTVRNEMKPLVASVQETVGIVQDTARSAGQTVSAISNTAKLTSEFALAPVIHTAAALVAGQGMLRVFLGKGRARTRAEERRQQQKEAMQAAQASGGDL